VVVDEHIRREKLCEAENLALNLLARIEASHIVVAGRTEREVEEDIYALAEREFGVEKHWHKRIARAGVNTLTIASDNPPVA
jgi:Xaa-Pro dipeptidase